MKVPEKAKLPFFLLCLGVVYLLFGMVLLGGQVIAPQEVDPTTATYVQILNYRTDTLKVEVRWPGDRYVLGAVPPNDSRVYQLPPRVIAGTALRLRLTLEDGWTCVTVASVEAYAGEVITLRMYDGPIVPSFCPVEKQASAPERQA